MRKNKLLAILTPSQLEQEFKELGSVPKIAKKYKLNTATVYTAFKIVNFNPYISGRNVSKTLTKEQLQIDYNDLQSIRKIAEKYNISHETVRYYIHKHNIDYNHLVRYDCDQHFFSRETEEAFYLAGFLAADGSVGVRKNSDSFFLYIGLAASERVFLENIKNVLKAESPIHEFLVTPSTSSLCIEKFKKVEIKITSKQIFDDLAKFNIVPRKTFIYDFPEWLINHKFLHHFMRGYSDGDGSFYVNLKKGKKLKQVYYNVKGTKNLLENWRKIFKTFNSCNGYFRKVGNIWDLSYGGNNLLSDIANFLYKDATIYLPRKYQIIKHLIKDLNGS